MDNRKEIKTVSQTWEKVNLESFGLKLVHFFAFLIPDIYITESILDHQTQKPLLKIREGVNNLPRNI